MSHGSATEDALSTEELTDATDTDPEELERQAADLEIETPETATVVDE